MPQLSDSYLTSSEITKPKVNFDQVLKREEQTSLICTILVQLSSSFYDVCPSLFDTLCAFLLRGTGNTSVSFNMTASISLRDAREALKKYLPYSGLAGYSVLALHSVKVHPEEIIIGKDSRAIIFHGALVLSGMGLSTYLYTRPVFDVMQPPKKKRVLWSLFGSLMFNFGSLLFWAIRKEIFPKNKVLRAFIALSSSAGLVYIARDYLEAVDALRWAVIAERTEGGQEL